MVKVTANLDMSQIIEKMPILIKIFENLDFGQITNFAENLWKSRFSEKLFRKISILVKIFENLNVG